MNQNSYKFPKLKKDGFQRWVSKMGFKDGFQRHGFQTQKRWVSKAYLLKMSFAFIFTEFVYKIKDIRQISLSDSFFFF